MFQFPGFALTPPMNSAGSDWELPQPSFLIQKSPDQRSFASFPELIAGYHVFRRLLMPRHPPYTLSSLTTFIDHRRVPRTSLTGTSETGRACRDSCNPVLERATELTRSLTGQIAKKVLDDSPPDRKTKWAGVAEFIAYLHFQ